MNESTPPQIVYYTAHGDKMDVYCEVYSRHEQMPQERFNELAKAVQLLNSVGCNISLRHVGAN